MWSLWSEILDINMMDHANSQPLTLYNTPSIWRYPSHDFLQSPAVLTQRKDKSRRHPSWAAYVSMSRCHWILFSILLPQYLMCEPRHSSQSVPHFCCCWQLLLQSRAVVQTALVALWWHMNCRTVYRGKFQVQSSYKLVNWIFSCEGHLKFKSDII